MKGYSDHIKDIFKSLDKLISHLRVTSCLCFKTRESSYKNVHMEMSLIGMKMNLQAELIFMRMLLTRFDIEAKGNKEMAYNKISCLGSLCFPWTTKHYYFAHYPCLSMRKTDNWKQLGNLTEYWGVTKHLIQGRGRGGWVQQHRFQPPDASETRDKGWRNGSPFSTERSRLWAATNLSF